MKGTELSLDKLAEEIQQMRYWHPLFKVLKRELTMLGYWHNHKRGNPKLGWIKSKQNEKNI